MSLAHQHLLRQASDSLRESYKDNPSATLIGLGVASTALALLGWATAHEHVLTYNPTYCTFLSRATFIPSFRLGITSACQFNHALLGSDSISLSDEFTSSSSSSSIEDVDTEELAQQPLDNDDNVEHSLFRFDAQGNLIRFYDSRGSIVLSSIPREIDHILELRGQYHIEAIDFYTLNEAFERNDSGFSDLIFTDPLLSSKRYPTPDFGSPSLLDLIRAVDDLRHRPRAHLAVVHCKAGHGRSATVVIAYLLTQLLEEGRSPSLDQVIHYLRLKRPCVSINRAKRDTLLLFLDHLSVAGSFEKLRSGFSSDIQDREFEIIQENL